MNVRKVLAGAVAGGLLMLAAPAANALCAVCDGDGCHVTTGPCGTSATPEDQQAMYGGGGGVSSQRDGAGYVGSCRIAVANDTSPDGTLGGQRVWNGEVNILVAASTPGGLVTTADCYVKVTASGAETMALSAVTGGPVAAAAGQVTVTADVTDTVYICTHVATTTSAETDDCAALYTTPVCPFQVCGPGGPLDRIDALLRAGDPVVCSVLVTLAPTVDGLPIAGLLYIDPATGDAYAGRGAPIDVLYDCPPYQATT